MDSYQRRRAPTKLNCTVEDQEPRVNGGVIEPGLKLLFDVIWIFDAFRVAFFNDDLGHSSRLVRVAPWLEGWHPLSHVST